MTRNGGAHFGNRLRKFCESPELAQLLCSRVAFVVQVLPTSCGIFADNLQSSVCCRVDEDVSPRRRNLQVIDPFQIFIRNAPALRFVTKAAFGSAQPAYADVLQTFEIGHRNEICLCISERET